LAATFTREGRMARLSIEDRALFVHYEDEEEE
jgi:hypothetical protein